MIAGLPLAVEATVIHGNPPACYVGGSGRYEHCHWRCCFCCAGAISAAAAALLLPLTLALPLPVLLPLVAVVVVVGGGHCTGGPAPNGCLLSAWQLRPSEKLDLVLVETAMVDFDLVLVVGE